MFLKTMLKLYTARGVFEIICCKGWTDIIVIKHPTTLSPLLTLSTKIPEITQRINNFNRNVIDLKGC